MCFVVAVWMVSFRSEVIIGYYPDSVQVPTSSSRDGEYYLCLCFLHLLNPMAVNKSAGSILSQAAEYQSTASQHRLNQPPTLNAGLQAANAAQIKAKISNLKQVKGDTITMEATLFYFPKNGVAAKKVNSCISYSCSFLTDALPLKAQLLPVLKFFFGSDPAKSVLDHACTELHKAWVESPASNVSGINAPNFEE